MTAAAMKFYVTRTSLYDQRIPPCDGAVCLTSNPTEYDGVWEIEIASLDELWDFIDANGDVILSRRDPTIGGGPAGDGKQCHLEIYDEYRE